MARLSFDIVGFDLDGTLLDTRGDLAAAVNYAIGTIGRAPFPVDSIRPFVGKGAKDRTDARWDLVKVVGSYKSEDYLPPLKDLGF